MLKAKTINTIRHNSSPKMVRNGYCINNLYILTCNLTSSYYRYINKRICLGIRYYGKLRMYINDFHNICLAFNTKFPNNLRENAKQNRFHVYQQTLHFYKTTNNNTLKYQNFKYHNYNNYESKYGSIFQHSVFGIGSYFIDSNNKTFHFSLWNKETLL